jgi:hypothetical protein
MKDKIEFPKGRVELFQVTDDGVWIPHAQATNTVLYDWGFIAAKAIGTGDGSYRVNTMYIEFENVAAPADAVGIPSFTRDEGLTYYNGLAGNQDFLRVGLLGLPTISIESGYEAYFGADEGNLLTFLAQSEGTAGVLGNATFSAANNSKVFGAALVASPVNADRTKDVVFSRTYFAVADQVLKQASSQICLSWEVPFT